MSKYKVRHRSIRWVETRNNQPFIQRAFRDQVVEIPQEHVARLVEAGAIVGADVELTPPGRMAALAESPTDAEIVNWVAVATTQEIESLTADRPILVSRIEGALSQVRAARQREMDLLDNALVAARRGAGDADPLATPATFASGMADDGTGLPRALVTGTGPTIVGSVVTDGGEPMITDTGAEDTGSGGSDDETGGSGADTGGVDPNEIVKGSVSDVSDFLSENPSYASAILDAEVRRTDGKPRQGVVNAAQAAAGHTQ